MQITVAIRKPRNPLVAPSLHRRAGRHQSGRSAQRQQAGRALMRELDPMERSP